MQRLRCMPLVSGHFEEIQESDDEQYDEQNAKDCPSNVKRPRITHLSNSEKDVDASNNQNDSPNPPMRAVRKPSRCRKLPGFLVFCLPNTICDDPKNHLPSHKHNDDDSKNRM